MAVYYEKKKIFFFEVRNELCSIEVEETLFKIKTIQNQKVEIALYFFLFHI